VQLIQRALVIGFSLADLARVLGERDRGGAPCRRVHQLVSDRLEDLDRQLLELTALRADLAALLAGWTQRFAGTAPGTRAHLLDTLGARPEIERARQRRNAKNAKSADGALVTPQAYAAGARRRRQW
jgi:DNA-binding transcriptional MerR regulator